MSFNPFIRKVQEDKSYSIWNIALGASVAGMLGGARFYKLTGRDPIFAKALRNILTSKLTFRAAAVTSLAFWASKTITPLNSRKSH